MRDDTSKAVTVGAACKGTVPEAPTDPAPPLGEQARCTTASSARGNCAAPVNVAKPTGCAATDCGLPAAQNVSEEAAPPEAAADARKRTAPPATPLSPPAEDAATEPAWLPLVAVAGALVAGAALVVVWRLFRARP